MIVNNQTHAHILRGKSRTGKSSIIRGIAQHLLYTSGTTILHPQDFEIPKTGDFSCIIEHINKKNEKIIYAFMSAGDNVDEIENQWETLGSYPDQINILIGASRTKNETRLWWNDRSDSLAFTKHWFDCNDKYPPQYANPIIIARTNVLKSILNVQ